MTLSGSDRMSDPFPFLTPSFTELTFLRFWWFR